MNRRRRAQARELLTILREGTFAGTLRYIRHKSRVRRSRRATDSREGTPAVVTAAGPRNGPRRAGMGILGAGTYVASVHLPLLRSLGVPLAAIVSASGGTAASLARTYDIAAVGETAEDVIADANVRSLLIATPHFLHPRHIVLAADAGHYSYCEKPVAIDAEGIDRIERDAACRRNGGRIMVGFNRRFAPAVEALRREPWLAGREAPMEIHYRVNFGARIDNAMSDPRIGGGRIHGAACHYVDLMAYLVGAPIVQVAATARRVGEACDDDTFAASLAFADGSVGSLVFTSEGDRETDVKEEVIMSCDRHTARLHDFDRLRIDGRRRRFHRHAHGALAAWRAFLSARDRQREVPVPLSDGIAATRVTLAIQRSIRAGGAVEPPA